jgi:hypothetical protein
MATLKNTTVSDTGFIRIAEGTTAQRPASPQTGMIRYNTSLSVTEFWNGSAWIPIQRNTPGDTSTGGSITTTGGFRIHTFTTNGTFTPTNTGVVDVLVVAGGGGGTAIGGGGGGGGYIYVAGYPVIAGAAYPITIGTGGAGAPTHTVGTNAAGTSSTFTAPAPAGTGTITTTGGGRGAPYPNGPSGPGFAGGSGGGGPGGGGPSRPSVWFPGGNGTANQGYPGGIGTHFNVPAAHYGGGGGGGAGSQGYNRGLNIQGRGGEGVASTIGGTLVYRAGGGSGGTHTIGTHADASLAGRGSLGDTRPGSLASAGGNNIGGGGAGGNHPSPDVGGTGGPGVVIVRYRP